MRSISMLVLITVIVFGLVLVGCQQDSPQVTAPDQSKLARAKGAEQAGAQVNSNRLELVAGFTGPMPTGVAVSSGGRIFVNYPRWGDPVEHSVVELKNGKPVPYPNREINKLDEANPSKSLIGVQSVVVDDRDRLWIVDTGSINFQPHKPGAAKLVCVDLKTDQVVKTIPLSTSPAVHRTTYLNDIRFDLDRNLGFITDSSDSGPNGIIVVNLESGEAWRRLNDHPSTKAQQNFAPVVEGEPLMARIPGKPEAYPKIGSDGIAISGDRKTLFYCPLIGRRLYSVSVDALADRNKSDDDVAATVKDLGDRGYCSDGLETDRQGRILLTDYEHNAIHVRDASGANDQILVQDPRIIWPDSMSARQDGFVYFTANQLNRQKNYHNGKDLRQQPYALFRVPLNAASRTESASAR